MFLRIIGLQNDLGIGFQNGLGEWSEEWSGDWFRKRSGRGLGKGLGKGFSRCLKSLSLKQNFDEISRLIIILIWHGHLMKLPVCSY